MDGRALRPLAATNWWLWAEGVRGICHLPPMAENRVSAMAGGGGAAAHITASPGGGGGDGTMGVGVTGKDGTNSLEAPPGTIKWGAGHGLMCARSGGRRLLPWPRWPGRTTF